MNILSLVTVPLVSIIFINGIGAEAFPSSKSVKSGYYQPCNKTQRCNNQSWLSCDSEQEICVCAKPEDMIYNLAKRKCVSLIGEKCKYGFDEDVSSAGTNTKVQSLWYEQSECVDGAICSTSGICVCPHGFYDDTDSGNPQCLPVKGQFEFCQHGLQCNADKILTCIDSSCKCAKPNDMVYNITGGNCRIKIGKPCYNPYNSSHSFNEDSEITDILINSTCVDGSHCNYDTLICSCPVGFYIDYQTNKCVPVKGYGEACFNRTECNSAKTLICDNGVCKCDHEKSVYNTEQFTTYLRNRYDNLIGVSVLPGICVMKAQVNCQSPYGYGSTTGSETYCMNHAHCSSTGTCECSAGYSQTLDNQCGRNFGHVCSKTEGCNDKFLCSTASPMESPKCDCPHPRYQIYDDKNQTCRGTVGAPCTPDDHLSCIANTHCTNKRNHDERYRCECNAGFVESVITGNCDIEYGNPCQYNKYTTMVCDRLGNLTCRGKWLSEDLTCSCANEDDFYEPEKRKCFIRVGIKCNDSSQCVSNSVCEKPKELANSGISGRCSCIEEFSSTLEFTCAANKFNSINPGEGLSSVVGFKDLTNSVETDGPPFDMDLGNYTKPL